LSRAKKSSLVALTRWTSQRISVTTLKAGSTATVGTRESLRLRPSLTPISR
jgi:hypothetical protein